MTEFHFIYHLKGLYKPRMMILLPQFLNYCKQSYSELKFPKKRNKQTYTLLTLSTVYWDTDHSVRAQLFSETTLLKTKNFIGYR